MSKFEKMKSIKDADPLLSIAELAFTRLENPAKPKEMPIGIVKSFSVDVCFGHLTNYCRGRKIKIRQFNFELTFNGLIFKGNGLSQCSL